MTYEATKILEQNMKAGTGTGAQIGCPAAGKTGTTDNNTDAWFVGYTPNLSTAVWVGFPGQRVPMNPPTTPISVAGGTYPASIWQKYMKVAKKGCGDFSKPKQAFQSKPFFGRYAREGGKDDDEGRGRRRASRSHRAGRRTGAREDTPRRRRPDGGNGEEAPAGNDDAAFDPGALRDPAPGTARDADGSYRRRSGGAHRRLTAASPTGTTCAVRVAPQSGGWWCLGGALRDGYGCREVVQRREGLRLHHSR